MTCLVLSGLAIAFSIAALTFAYLSRRNAQASRRALQEWGEARIEDRLRDAETREP